MHYHAEIPSHLQDVVLRYKHLRPNLTVKFHGFWFEESAPHSFTVVNQWVSYMQKYHLPSEYHEIQKLQTVITFGGKVEQKVEVSTVGPVKICVPLPGYSFFDYESILIVNDVQMIFGLSTQIRLWIVTEKNSESPKVHLRALNVTIPLIMKFNHIYYEGPSSNDFLFSSAELAKIHRNIVHAPPGSVFHALRSYPVEIGSRNL